MSFSTFLILLSLSSDCADSFRELYSNSTFDQFYDQTVEGGLAPRIEGERLGALILDTRRMQIYLRPRELRSEDYFYFVNRRNQRLIGVITVHMHSWSPFISVYFNRYFEDEATLQKPIRRFFLM